MSYIVELKELAKLKDDSILTDEEFQKKKEEILSSSSQTEPGHEEEPQVDQEDAPPKKKIGFFGMIFHRFFRTADDIAEDILDTALEDHEEWKSDFERKYPDYFK